MCYVAYVFRYRITDFKKSLGKQNYGSQISRVGTKNSTFEYNERKYRYRIDNVSINFHLDIKYHT